MVVGGESLRRRVKVGDWIRLPQFHSIRSENFVVNSLSRLAAAMAIAAASLASTAIAAPTITNITPRSLAVGGTTTLTIEGADLATRPRVLLPIPIERQEVKPGGTASRVQIEVKLPVSIAAGIRPLRVAADTGISGPVPDRR